MGILFSKKLGTVLTLLEKTPFSLYLSRSELKALAKNLKLVILEKNFILQEKDEEVKKVFLVAKGVVKEKMDSSDAFSLRTCINGDVINFSEIDKSETSLEVASEVAEVYVIPKAKLNKILSRLPDSSGLLKAFNPDVLSLISCSPLFDLSSLEVNQKRELAAQFRLEKVEKGDFVYKKGERVAKEENGKLYVVFQGKFTETLSNEDMRDLSKGNVFGELALIHFTPRNSTVSCTESGLLLSLSQGDFFKFLLKNENSKFLENYIMCAKQFLSDSLKDTKLPVFDGLPDEEFPNLVKKCTWEWHNPETLIFKEGDIGTTFYIILFGILEVKKEQKILTTLGAEKGYFGEIALVTDQNRTANVYATTLSVLLSVTKNTFQEMFSSNPEFLAQFQVKLAPAQASLKHILFHMIGFKCFYKQMTAEHSTENIDFWRDAVAFSKLDSQEERIAFGKEIVKKYISKDAEQRVNLKGVTRKEILDICERDESYTKDFFEGAEREIFDLMERDSWARFKNGTHFQDFLKEVGGSYTEVADLEKTKVGLNIAAPNRAASHTKTSQLEKSLKPSEEKDNPETSNHLPEHFANNNLKEEPLAKESVHQEELPEKKNEGDKNNSEYIENEEEKVQEGEDMKKSSKNNISALEGENEEEINLI